jgi:hypothetical protein
VLLRSRQNKNIPYKQKHQSTIRALVTTLTFCLGSFYYGYQQGVTNIPEKQIKLYYGINGE